MRDLDYRAWHKQQKIMFAVTSLHWDNNKIEGVSALVNGHAFYAPAKDVELMQYTGLVDKHGKQACEGDLVKMFDRSLFRIVWDDFYARFQLELVKGHELKRAHCMDMLQFNEVIGNVYEHPELLAVS